MVLSDAAKRHKSHFTFGNPVQLCPEFLLVIDDAKHETFALFLTDDSELPG